VLMVLAAVASAQGLGPEVLVGPLAEGDMETTSAVRLLLFLTGLSFLPTMLIVMTPFVRFVVVLSLARQALGLAQSPPNQVIVGLSAFLTLLVMQPAFEVSWAQGVAPYLDGTLDTQTALERSVEPLRGFMLLNIRRTEMAVVLQAARMPEPETLAEIPISAVVSAFVLSELQTAFTIAVYVYLPFVVIDLVVSSVLLGLGMMMLPPVMVSLPFKLLIFVLMDGWALLVSNLVAGVAT
jgi:flagellar biosynthetic protein FliP